jgi:tripartite ATP-independent transporter DctM subunit
VIRIIDRFIDKVLSGMGVAAIFMMLILAAFIVAQVFSRFILRVHILGLFDLSVYCLIAFTFLIPAYTLAKQEHVTVDVLVEQFPETIRGSLDIGVYLVSFLFPLLLGWYAWQWAHACFSRGVLTVAGLPIPKGILISSIPVGCIFLSLQIIKIFVKNISVSYGYVRTQRVSGKQLKDNPVIAPLIFLTGIIICLAMLKYMNSALCLAILVLFLLFSGMPVFIALGLSGAAGLYFLIDPATMPQVATMAYKAVDKFSLTCLPLFVLAGIIFERGKVLDKVFLLLEMFTGRFVSASLVSTILIGGFFCAVTGSSVGATGAIAAVMLPLLLGRGYSKSLSSGTIAGSTIGLIIPPSMAYILYGVITGESIAQLFMAGIGPGALLFGFYILYVVVRGLVSKRSLFEKGMVPSEIALQKVSWNDRLVALRMASWGLFTPIFVLGGIYLGVFTPTEAAAVMVVYAIVVCVFIMRTLSWRDVIESSLRGAEISSMILCIIAGAMILGAVVSQLRIAVNLASFVQQAGFSAEAILAFIFLTLFILGMFLDGASIMVITLPIFYPLARAVGINSVWFGVFYTLSIEIGLLTPPVGLNLFVIKGISGLSLATVIKGTAPFLFIMAFSLLLMCLYPQLVLWLPSTMLR